MTSKPKLLTLKQLAVAEWFPYASRTIYRLIKAGKLKARKLSSSPETQGAAWYIEESDAIAFLNKK